MSEMPNAGDPLPPDRSLRAARWARFALGLVVAIVLLVAAAPVFFSFPLYDDFSRAQRALHMGVFENLRYEYFHWSGRLFSTWIASLVGTAGQRLLIYRCTNVAISSIACLSLFQIAKSLFPHFPIKQRVAIAALFLALWWTRLSPASAEIIYWLAASAEYLLSLALAGLAVAFAARGLPVSKAGQLLRLIMVAMLAVAAGACHELTAVLLTIVAAAGAWSAFHFAAPSRKQWYVLLGSAVAIAAFSILAPGNAERRATLPTEERGILMAAFYFGWQLLLYLPGWFADVAFIAVSLLFVINPSIARYTPPWLAGRERWYRRISLPTWIFAVLVGFFLPAFGQVSLTSPRTVQAIYLIFLLGWFLTLFIWTRGVAVSASERFHAFPLARPVVIGLLAVSLIATRQFGEGLIDALYRAPQAGRQWESRDRELRQAVAEGKTTRVVPRIRRWPYVYPRYEISREPTDPINRVLADYYGLKSLAAETE